MMSSSVYSGFWVDWVDGKTKGSTLTLTQFQGPILLSFLTLYVRFSGACLWIVVCFILHQVRSTVSARDGQFHQQQTILRNAITAPNTLYNLYRSAIVWRGKVDKPILNSLALILITVFHVAFWGAAGLFSSRVTNTKIGAALVTSPVCGFPVELPNPRATESQKLTRDELEIFNVEILMARSTLEKSAAYVRTCYNDSTSDGLAACNLYIKPHLVGIKNSTTNNGSCPFGGDACAATPIRFDSGYVHSNEDLGINYPEEQSLSVRRVTTCAPVRGEENYATDWVEDVPEAYANQSTTDVKFYEFGKSNLVDGCEGTTENVTTDYKNTFCVTKYMQQNFQAAYTLRASTVYHGNENASDFDPIPDFRVENADVTLAAIMSRALYAGNSSDPLYNVSTKVASYATDFYRSNNDLNILGCTEQYQFCNIGNGKCTDLTGLYGITEAVTVRDSLSLTPMQSAIYAVLWKAAWASSLQWSLEILSDQILLAQDKIFTAKSTTSAALSANQWELEAQNLHNIALAVFQRRVHEYAAPENFEISPGVMSHTKINEPTDPLMRDICGRQKVRANDHVSVNVLGMCIILVVGGLCILFDWFFIEQIFWWRSLTHAKQTKKADWMATGTLQLQRQALEARGIGPWNVRDYEFPILAQKGQVFYGLATQPMNTQLTPGGHGFEVGGQGWQEQPTGGGEGIGLGWSRTEYNGGAYAAVPGDQGGKGGAVHRRGDSGSEEFEIQNVADVKK